MPTQLLPRELALVFAYRSLPDEQRLAVRNLIDTLAASHSDRASAVEKGTLELSQLKRSITTK